MEHIVAVSSTPNFMVGGVLPRRFKVTVVTVKHCNHIIQIINRPNR